MYLKTSCFAACRVGDTFLPIHSVFRLPKKLSAAALSQQLPSDSYWP